MEKILTILITEPQFGIKNRIIIVWPMYETMVSWHDIHPHQLNVSEISVVRMISQLPKFIRLS